MLPSDKSASKRRVPDSLRRRTQVSCDRCKKRRIRCIRDDGDDGSCKTCLDGGFACQSTAPRKKRLYGSAEALSLRYRALDALVKGLFADENVDDVQTLFRLAVDRGIDMPAADESTINADAFNDGISAVSQSPDSFDMQTKWPCNIDQTVQGTVVGLAEETCIPAPHGVAHYVGPASSFEFASAIRQLVAKRSSTLDNERTRQNRRSRLRAEFAQLKTSIAMEPRIQAHPASTVREEGHERDVAESVSAQATPAHGAVDNQAEPHGRPSSPYRRWVQALLPVRSVCDNLVQAFFDKVHPNYVLFHRGTFQSRYESIWYRTSAYTYEAEPGWLCCLFMVLAFGAQALEHHNLNDATTLQRRFLKFVRERFQHLALTASLANVQALLLLQLYEHNAGERNTSWILLGQAARMAVALGMHREGTSHNFDSIERNTRRMVWFTLYSFEQYAALMLGRPSTIKALEVNVGLPEEAIMDGSDYPPEYLNHASMLLDLSSKVRHFATAASPNCFNPPVLGSLLDSVTTLIKELQTWREQLPQHLRPDSYFISNRHRRAVLLLHTNYHYLASVLTRPYLLCRVDCEIRSYSSLDRITAQTSNPAIDAMAQESVQSSSALGAIIQQLSDCSMLEGIVWVDFFYLYHALLVLCLDCLVATTNRSSGLIRQTKEQVASMVSMCQTNRLSPTYHILSQVSIQFAHIVGLVGDDAPSRDELDQPMNATSQQPLPTTDLHSAPMISQYDMFVPFAEPISDVQNFHNHDAFWDFFNVGGYDGSGAPQDATMAYLPTPFSHLSNVDGGSIPGHAEHWNA
ncbi:hypothetical protein PMZ80_009531 [Knufia obscura]|uniref:Zn(2)-C6 fungal-type domain-containing protein n=1 Tax=Knufia obscura TaxID=1635080 RepID=A0ABR0REM8_9EURO|nr:hypothetical protein PMZ80_009531 [Knufia obscura]